MSWEGSWEDPREPEDRLYTPTPATSAAERVPDSFWAYFDRTRNYLAYSKGQLLAFGGITAALALGGVAWDTSSARHSQPNIEASSANVFPNCAPPSQQAVKTVRQLFRPYSHKAIYPGVAGEQLGLRVPEDDPNLFYFAESMPEGPARVKAHIKAANSELVDSGLKLIVGTPAYAKDGWQVPSAQEMQSGNAEDDQWEITSETSALPEQYVSLSGIKRIALMYKKAGPEVELFSTGKHKDDTIVYNIAYDQFTGQTSPVNEEIALQIDQRECAVGKKDPAWEKINGGNIYGKDKHKGLLAEQPTDADALIFNLEDKQYEADKAGNKKAFCQATEDIAQINKDRIVVESPADFATESADKADIGTMVSYPTLLGWALNRNTPAIREKTLLSLERLEDLDGPGQDGPAVVQYFTETYVSQKPEPFKNKIDC